MGSVFYFLKEDINFPLSPNPGRLCNVSSSSSLLWSGCFEGSWNPSYSVTYICLCKYVYYFADFEYVLKLFFFLHYVDIACFTFQFTFILADTYNVFFYFFPKRWLYLCTCQSCCSHRTLPWNHVVETFKKTKFFIKTTTRFRTW